VTGVREVTVMPSKRTLDLLKAAYYSAYDPDLTQDQIASRVGLTQVQVSRLLKEAREQKILREVIRFPPDLSPEDHLEVVNSFFPQHGQLEEALSAGSKRLSKKEHGGGAPFKKLYVVAAPGIERDDPRMRADAVRSFGMSAAGIVASYIDEVETCCVAWGRTIAATVDYMPKSKGGASDKAKRFIPIAGEPTNHEPNGIAPSDAARRLSLAWPGSTSFSLRGVQARIPKSVDDEDGSAIARKLIGHSNNYRQIFGAPGSDETPLISEVPMIFTGLGNVDTSKRDLAGVSDPWYTETVDAEGPDVLKLAVGNIGGVWIARNEIDNADKDLVAKVNERWLGAQYDHFKGCALSADPGVVVVAVEPDKAEIVLETLHLINVLIVSRQLADALATRLRVG
jgi:DNA-binding transcriptional regulator LsrR (DeoR family)